MRKKRVALKDSIDQAFFSRNGSYIFLIQYDATSIRLFKPAIKRSTVVLPQPDGPKIVRNSPWFIVRSKSEMTVLPSKDLVNPESFTTGGCEEGVGAFNSSLPPSYRVARGFLIRPRILMLIIAKLKLFTAFFYQCLSIVVTNHRGCCFLAHSVTFPDDLLSQLGHFFFKM